MASSLYHAVARVQVCLEVDVGPYGNDWKLEDIYADAERNAREKIEGGHLKAHEGKIVAINKILNVIVKKEL
jgi:hypothetical protein